MNGSRLSQSFISITVSLHRGLLFEINLYLNQFLLVFCQTCESWLKANTVQYCSVFVCDNGGLVTLAFGKYYLIL